MSPRSAEDERTFHLPAMRGEGVQTEPVRVLFHTAVPFLVLLTALTLLLGPAHVDFFPLAGVFHLSLGIHHYSGGISGRAVPSEGIEINDREYSPEEIGVFTARIWGRQTAPFIGLGWQGRSGRVQPYVDLGALLTGSPRVSVHVPGVIADDPQFQSDLDEEIREIEDELSAFRVFPHLSFGMRFRIGD